MKYFGLISTWTAAIALSLCLRGAGKQQADPTDDFSFTLDHSQQFEVFRLMPEHRVTEIFQDRLDLFPRSEASKLSRHLLELCRQYRFDPAFVLSLIQVESSFRVKAVSPDGAVGLMQVMPATALKVAEGLGLNLLRAETHQSLGSALLDPFFNLKIGVSYLAFLRDRYEGLSPFFLVAAYNVGPGKVDELRLRKSFQPVNSRKYFDAIRRGVPDFRFYQPETKTIFESQPPAA
ncbi:transglycosylase SLT domain-containing protein [Bdellovibrionota bacterium FG-1]